MEHGAMVVAGAAAEAVALVRTPAETLEAARSAAVALMSVVNAKPNKVEFNGEQYLENEDWQTIAAFYGCTVDMEWTRPVSFDNGTGTMISGWEARAVLTDRNGRILSHAEAMCLNDEERWGARPKYAWAYKLKSGGFSVEDPGPDEIIWEPNPAKPGRSRPAKERRLIGTETVPMFQLRSMAQTRAASKVLSNVFRWVVQLAGYRGTPAEEIDGQIARERRDKAGEDRHDNVETAPAQAARRAPAKARAQTAGPAQDVPHPAETARNVTPAAPATQNRTTAPATVVDTRTGEELPALKVANVVEESYKDRDGKQQPMWRVTFSDGRQGMAFEAALSVVAEKAKQEGAIVDAVLVDSTRRPGMFKLTELAIIGSASIAAMAD